MARVEVSNEELRTVRDAMRELNQMIERLDTGESEKYVLTKSGQMRAVVVSLDAFAHMRRALDQAEPAPLAGRTGLPG